MTYSGVRSRYRGSRFNLHCTVFHLLDIAVLIATGGSSVAVAPVSKKRNDTSIDPMPNLRQFGF